MLQLCELSDHIDHISAPIIDIGLEAGMPHLLDEVIEAIEAQNAFLFMDGKTFTVLKPTTRSGKKILLIWIAYGLENESAKKHFPQIKQFAKDLEVDTLEFWTVLPAIERHALSFGWKKSFTVYEIGIKL